MSQPFLNSLIPISVNLAAMVLIYSLLANALVRLHWRGRGAITVIALLFVAGLFWIVPGSWTLGGLSPRALWFGNWLVSGCSVVILCQRVRWIPRELEDLARMDGSGWFGTYRHITLPLVRRELAIIALLTLMGTSIQMWTFFLAEFPPLLDSPPWIMLFPANNIGLAMIAGSLINALPILLIFVLARRYLEKSSIPPGETRPTSSA